MERRTILTRAPAVVLGLLASGCGEVDTEPRTLPSGRQVDIFRIFTTGTEPRVVLDYFYVSRYFDDKVEFEREWAEVVQDAQQEADRRNAVELMLIANRRGANILLRLFREDERGRLFRKQAGTWAEVRPR